MNGVEQQWHTSDEYDEDSDPLDLLIADALAELALPPLEDNIDLETAAEALTEEDRQALAALGSPLERVARIVAAAKAKVAPTPQLDRSTQLAASATASTQFTGRPQPTESSLGFEELLRRMRDFESVEYLSWSSDYCNKGVIGCGGQGVVYLTEWPNEHHLPRALKVFSPEPYGDVGSYHEDMQRMAHVASLAYRMQVNNLVIIERLAFHNGLFVMIMPWIDGHDLAWLLQPRLLEQLHGCVDEERWKHLNNVVVTTPGTIQLCLMPGMAVNIIEKCLRALDALHSQDIVHGDIKPSNIMLDRYGSIRLIDIGSAFELSAPPQQHTWTPRYAPPEILEGGQWTPQSDLASLGYVLIELLSGQPAIASEIGSASTRTFDSARDAKLLDEKRRLPERLIELLPADAQKSEQLMNLCRGLINPDPKRRFVTAEEAMEGNGGTYEFLAGLTRARLAVYYPNEIKRWLEDVQKVPS